MSSAFDSSQYHAFDFWIGEWQVRTSDGNLAGHNRIERRCGGCALHEQYTTSRGYSGESLSIYDITRKVWHQTWVDNDRLLLLLEGNLQHKSMVLDGRTVSDGAQLTHHRITWTPNADGSIRQLWESTNGNGERVISFDATYTRL